MAAMPNGGVDNCGECVFNPDPARALIVGGPGRCEIRGIVTSRPFWTYCANFHTGARVPNGPVFAGFDEFGRLPWHGDRQPDYNQGDDGPCEVCDQTPSVLTLPGPTRLLLFCGGDHYLVWWRQANPGKSGEYPWQLHDAMFDPRRRASGRDAPRGIREHLLWWLRRRL
jgi:hypothetical protein